MKGIDLRLLRAVAGAFAPRLACPAVSKFYAFGKGTGTVHRSTGILLPGGVLGNIVTLGSINRPRVIDGGIRFQY